MSDEDDIPPVPEAAAEEDLPRNALDQEYEFLSNDQDEILLKIKNQGRLDPEDGAFFGMGNGGEFFLMRNKLLMLHFPDMPEDLLVQLATKGELLVAEYDVDNKDTPVREYVVPVIVEPPEGFEETPPESADTASEENPA